MEVHYDAFISYRHSPIDSAIAQRIHRQLERFRVPKAIQKATGKQKIRRIFRDNEELPLSVDLGDDIRKALANSDYLIVICSPRTQESQWVMREIRMFLETHTIDKVLIVLAEGEPEDVVPDLLIQGREPLCCNFRLSPRKAKQIELPRLASAILGCRYDDLRQRQRQYRTRQMVALFSVALAATVTLAFYFFQTSQKIQENYEQALINQSRYLSSTSLELLEEGDRLSAIALALEALPNEETPRPWIPEAEYALGHATNAYTSTPDVLPVTAFSHNNTVEGLLPSSDGKYLISWDADDRIYVWNTQTYQLRHTLKPGFSPREMPILLPDGKLLLWNSDGIFCGSCETPGALWQLAPGDYGYGFSGFLTIPDSQLAIASCSSKLLLIHTETGTVEKVISLPEGMTYLSELACVSPDGRYVVCIGYDYAAGYQPLLLSLEDESFRSLDVQLYYLDSALFSDNGKLYLSGMLEDTNSSYAVMDMVSLVPSTMDIICIDPELPTPLWHSQTTYYQVNYGSQMGNLDYVAADGRVRDAVYCCFSNLCIVLDAATGELLSRGEAATPILDVVHSGSRLRFLLKDGSLALFYPDTQSTASIRYFTDDLAAGRIVNDYSYYILPWTESRILLYSGEVYDKNYTFVTGSEDMTGQTTLAIGDKVAVFSGNGNLLSGCDLETKAILWQTQLPTSIYDTHVAGLTSQGQLLLLQNRSGYGDTAVPATLLQVDTADGKLMQIELTLPTSPNYDQYSITNSICALWGDGFAYLAKGSTLDINYETGEILSENGDFLMLLDPQTGMIREYPLPVAGVQYLLADQQGEKLFLGVPTEDTGMLCLILDRVSGEISIIETPIMIDTMTDHAQAAWAPDGALLAVPGDDHILLLRPDGTQAHSVDCKEQKVFSLCFNPAGELLVLYADGTLFRYDSTGSVLSQTDMYYYINGMTAYSFVDWHFGQQGCGINIGGLCTILDPESWQSYAYVPNCLLYAPLQDRFFVELETAHTLKIACYDRYTTEELIAMAKEILGDNSLTEDQRTRYGLNN